MTYAQLEHSILAWAHSQEPVRAAIVVGSRARLDHPADAWSDLDIILFVIDPAAYASSPGWLTAIGEIWLAVPSLTGGGDPEWDVIYAGGAKVDFVLAKAGAHPGPTLREWMEASPYRFVLERGVRILLDKSEPAQPDPAAILFPFPRTRPENPTPGQFNQAMQDAFLIAVRAAGFIQRGDLWRARQQVECAFKERLLGMLEWHTRAVYGPQTDPWYDGRSLDEWADRRALQALPGTCSAWSQASLTQALLNSLSLFRWLAQETASRLNFPYSEDRTARVTGWIHSTLSIETQGINHARP